MCSPSRRGSSISAGKRPRRIYAPTRPSAPSGRWSTCRFSGKEGFRKTALICMERAEYLKERCGAIRGHRGHGREQTFNEFTVDSAGAGRDIHEKDVAGGFAAGLPASLFYKDRPNHLIIPSRKKDPRAKSTVSRLRSGRCCHEAYIRKERARQDRRRCRRRAATERPKTAGRPVA